MGQEDPLEKEVTTHNSILAWEIPQIEETGGLQFMGSQGVGHELVTKQQLAEKGFFIDSLSQCLFNSL